MKQSRVLDPTHVLAVCAYAAQHDGGDDPARIEGTVTGKSVTVRITAEQARVAATQALQQAGYLATVEGDTITVRGWSAVHLAQRVARLDDAVQWLLEELSATARNAVEAYEDAGRRLNLTGRAARNLARTGVVARLRDRVQLEVGPLLWQDRDVRPADPKTAMLLRECRWLDDEADLLLSRHRAVATQAIAEHRTELARQRPDRAEVPESISAPPAEITPAPATAGRPGRPEPPGAPHRGRTA